MTPFKTALLTHREKLFQIMMIIVIVFGIILRASKYLPAWSMGGDELAVTLNLINRSATRLVTEPLDYEQAAPFAFLLLTKSLLSLFGRSEYVLRLVAFLSGCISLILMYRLLTRTVGNYGSLFAISAFAFAHYPIYYASELKQYSSDVLVCIVLALFFQSHLSGQANKRDFWALGIVGVLALCFSHPAVFLLFVIGFTLVLHYWKDKQRLIWMVIIGAVWAGTFLIIYLMLLRKQTQSPYLIQFWRDLNSYMPVPPWQDPAWFPGAIGHLFSNLGGLSLGLPFLLLVYIFGLWMFWREKKWQWMLVLTLPIGINMIVSGFQKFPFHGRLIIYLLPLVYLVFAKALDGLVRLIPNRLAANAIFLVFILLLLRPAFPTANMYLFTHSYLQDDLKPALSFIEERHQDRDQIYLYHYTKEQFEYYAPSYGLDHLVTFEGGNYFRNAKKYRDELDSLPPGERIWFLFSFVGETRVNKNEKQDEREYILNHLREEFYSTNEASSAHLYILR